MEEKLQFAITVQNEQAKQAIEQQTNLTDRMEARTQQAAAGMDKAFRNIAMAAGTMFSVQQAMGFANSIVQVRSQMQSLQVSFETLLGSKDKASAMFSELKDFAAKTPMQLQDLAQAAQTLLGFNYDQSKVVDMLKSIGDISMGDAERFKSLSLAFAQMSAMGKLMEQDLLQMVSVCFNPLSVISEKTGKSIKQLKDEMSKGAISAQMVEDAFLAATAAGGKFNGMLLAQGQTMRGSLAQLQGAWADFLNSLGEKGEGAMATGVGVVSTLLQNYEALGRTLLSVAATVGTYKAATMAVYVVEHQATVQTQLLTAAQAALNAVMKVNPLVLVATATAALAGTIWTLRSNVDGAKDAQAAFNAQLDEANKQKQEANQKTQEAITLASSANTSTEKRAESLKYLVSTYGSIISKYVDEEGHLTNIIQLQRELNQLQAARTSADYEKEAAKWERMAGAAKELNKYKGTTTYTSMYSDVQRDEQRKQYRALQEEYRKQKGWGADFVASNSDYQAFAQEMARLNRQQAKDTRTDQQVNQFVEAVSGMQTQEKVKWATALQKATTLIKGNVKRVAVKGIGTESYTEDQLKTMLTAVTGTATKQGGGEKPAAVKAGSRSKGAAASKQKDYAGEYNTLLEQNTQRQADEAQQAAFAIRQAEIAGMEAGFDKEIATAKLKYDQLEAQNMQRAQQMASQLQQQAQSEWAARNPQAAASGQKLDATGITANLLQSGGDVSQYSMQMQAAIKQAQQTLGEYHRVALMEYGQAETNAMQQVLQQVMSYQQERTKIEQEYSQKRAALTNSDGSLKRGVTQANMDVLNTQEADAIEQLNERWAQTSATYETLCQEIAQAGLKELVSLLKQCNSQLTTLKLTGKEDSKEAATLYAAISKIQKRYEEVNQTEQKTEDKSPDWQAIAKDVQKASGEVQQLGESLGGTVGEALEAAGQIGNSVSTIISSVSTLANTSIHSITDAVSAASAGMAALTATISIVQTIAGLFNNDDTLQEAIDDLQEKIDSLNWAIENQSTVRLIENTGSALEKVTKQLDAANQAWLTSNYRTNQAGVTMQYFLNRISAATNVTRDLTQGTAALAKAYEQVAYSADKALGDERYSDYADTLENYAQQMLAIREQISNEEDKKSTDSSQITEWEQSIEEIGQKMADLLNDMTEEILGGSAEDIASQLSDAFVEAFQNGEDAAEAWGDTVKDIVGDVIKRMMTQTLLENQVAAIYDKYKSQFFKDGKYVGGEQVIKMMNQFASDLMGLESNFEAFYNDLPEDLKEYMMGDDATRSGTTGEGITQASQDSVDEMNARLTTIQAHTYSLNENVKLVTQNTNAILQNVVKIEQHTQRLAAMEQSLEQLAGDTRVVRTQVDHFYNQGIRIK
jgi:tape measure domain-containing protein